MIEGKEMLWEDIVKAVFQEAEKIRKGWGIAMAVWWDTDGDIGPQGMVIMPNHFYPGYKVQWIGSESDFKVKHYETYEKFWEQYAYEEPISFPAHITTNEDEMWELLRRCNDIEELLGL